MFNRLQVLRTQTTSILTNLSRTAVSSIMPEKVKVHCVYCGGWGYKPKSDELQQLLADEFGDDVIYSCEPTPRTSGHLEVTVNGKLIHTKKGGDGYIDNEKKLQKIYDAVDAAKLN